MTLDDGSSHSYDKLLVATGGKVRKLSCPGSDLENIFTVRTGEDYDEIQDVVNDDECKNIVIVGGSFIGIEAAAILKTGIQERDINVTIIAQEEFPLQRVLLDEIGKMMKSENEKGGVHQHLQTGVKEIKGEDGKVKQVVLNNGEVVDADIVIVGVGVDPSTDYLKSTDNVKLDERGGVIVDEFMRTNDENIYAVGDLATYKYW